MGGKDNEGNTIGTPYANIWTMEFNYVATQAKSVINQFAHSIRCVKDEESYNTYNPFVQFDFSHADGIM